MVTAFCSIAGVRRQAIQLEQERQDREHVDTVRKHGQEEASANVTPHACPLQEFVHGLRPRMLCPLGPKIRGVALDSEVAPRGGGAGELLANLG